MLRATPLFAAKPLCSSFSLAAASFGAHHYRNAAASPSSVTPPARCNGQKQKAWFLLLQTLIRNRARSPLFGKAVSIQQQGSRKSQRSEIFGKRRSGARIRTLPLCGNARGAADCSDEGALFQRRGFGTRNLIKEKCNSICHPERSEAESKDLYKNIKTIFA